MRGRARGGLLRLRPEQPGLDRQRAAVHPGAAHAYKTAHPNQNLRILAIEDDDGACQIRLDGNRFKTFQTALQNAYPNLTGGKDSTSGLARIFKRANALQRILRAAYSWITSQDDLIGNAIEDSVVGEYHAAPTGSSAAKAT